MYQEYINNIAIFQESVNVAKLSIYKNASIYQEFTDVSKINQYIENI